MANNPYVVVDHILKDENQGIAGTYNISFTELDNNDQRAIQEWLKDGLQYTDITDAPELPDDLNNESASYETISGQRKIKGFKEVAFTGDYDSLSNAPEIPLVNGNRPTSFHSIAFTGAVNLENVQISKVINLSTMSLGNISQFDGWTQEELEAENDKLNNFGNSNMFVRGFGINATLTNTINQAYSAFYPNRTPTFFVTNQGTFQVLDADRVLDGTQTLYIEFDLAPAYNVEYIRTSHSNGATSDEAALDLSNISINSAKKQVWIFDRGNKTIYCKILNDLQTNDLGLANVATSGNYNDLSNLPVLDVSDANTSITGLHAVAISGSYGDLENKPDFNVSNTATTVISGLANVAISGSYIDLSNKPTIITDYNQLTGLPILNASTSTSSITGLADVAISGDYDDLSNKNYILNPGEFINLYNSNNNNWSILTGTNLEVMQMCGIKNGWIKNIDKLYSEQDNTTNSFIDELEELKNAFFTLGKTCYLYTSGQFLLITGIKINGVNDNMLNMSISCTPIIVDNFNTNFVNTTINSDSDIDNVFSNIGIAVYVSDIIVDANQKILYSIYNGIYQTNNF